ncbi:methyl-CpG-binding domain protein 3-like 2B [Peromyscus eremicus]|uniref:methyl-CpG-binding domain protein 3-like 2B n=1 Tax=Peromyscus eremicus TaxID=42410 RepID=UPI0027DAF434|nr:methyl-CpG-binding domain protein 3-like 2B [Peromyscus eremicus]
MEGPSGNPLPSQPLLGKLQRSMIPEKLQKRRAQAAKNKVKAKHRSGVTPVLPVRLTSCIFTRPVTRITSHPESKTMRRKEEEKLVKPRQLCALRRLQEYQEDSNGEQLHPLDLKNAVQRSALGTQAGARVPTAATDLHTEGEQLHPLDLTNSVQRSALGTQAGARVRRGALDLHTSPEFTSVQPPSSERKVPSPPSFYSQRVTTAVAFQLSPSFYRQGVTTADIRRQTRRVKNARKKLAAALEADRLARQAENMGNGT